MSERPHLLGPVGFDILQTMIRSDDQMLTTKQIIARAGYHRWEITGALESLRGLGLVRRYIPKYSVSERGRIAWALEAARRERAIRKRLAA